MKDHKWVGLAVAMAALLGPSGCDAIFGDGYEVLITTDESEYVAHASTTISVTSENRSDNAVYYLCAGEYLIERLEDGEPVDAIGLGNCECLCWKPIEPGRSESRDIPLNERLLEWILTGPSSDRTTYRVRFILYENESYDHELELENQLSNSFRLHPAR